MPDNVWGLRHFRREFFTAAMLNSSLKSRFLKEFSRFGRILAGLVGYNISPLEYKKVKKNKKRD